MDPFPRQLQQQYRQDTICFYVNGQAHSVRNPEPDTSLIQYLRSQGLTGTKLGCNEGGCGACTIMVSHYDEKHECVVNRSVNACLAPLCAMDGHAIVTVEGIGSSRDILHVVQDRIKMSNGSQCGFCTPGIVMSLYTLIRNHPYPTEHQIEQCLDGNLCRCTGYRPILEAARTLTSGCGKKDCCQLKQQEEQDSCHNHEAEEEHVYTLSGQKHPIFPVHLKKKETIESLKRDIHIVGDNVEWYRPCSLQSLMEIRSKLVEINRQRKESNQTEIRTRFVIGNSELAIETRLKNQQYPVLICLTDVPELNEIYQVTQSNTLLNSSTMTDGVFIGASATLTNIWQYFEQLINSNSEEYRVRGLKAIIEQLKWFASTPIRNAASVGGNIITASPISDLNPLWMALNTQNVLMNVKSGEKRVVPMRTFFKDYRIVDMADDEILYGIYVPFIRSELEFIRPYKQAKRREDDIAIVNAGMRLLLQKNDDQYIISEVSLNFGGMNKYSVAALRTEDFLLNKPLSSTVFNQAIELLKQDMKLPQNVPGGMAEFRQALCLSFLFKFYLHVQNQVQQVQPQEEQDQSALLDLLRTREYPYGTQKYRENKRGTSVGEAKNHLSAHLQVTGEAKYLDDVPPSHNELHAAMVLTTLPYARILSVDISRATEVPGFRGYVDHVDIPGKNLVGATHIEDEELFITKMSTSTGQVIGLILADTPQHAKLAASLVQVNYDTTALSDPILSIQDAIKHNSYQGVEHTLKRGDFDQFLSQVKQQQQDNKYKIIEGDLQMGGQEHFYLEPNGALAIPGEQDEMTVYSSMQSLTKTQQLCSKILNVPGNRIIAKTKRIGGGFGGKETRGAFYAAMCVVAARKYRSPVRLIFDRDVDMCITGQRHPFYYKYIAVINTEKHVIEGIKCEMYCNGGFSTDLSQGVIDRAIFSFDNVYQIPHLTVVGKICLTHMPSNTAFRGFGGPQGMFIMEHVIDHAAQELKNTVATNCCDQLRTNMLYKENDTTHYGQVLDANRIAPLWEQLFEKSEYESRREQVEQFNRTHRYKKRGIYAMPTKYGISFTTSFLNQGGALVHIYYHDGSVLVSHGGIEMGQGLHTKCAQCAASVLGISLDKVFIAETSTDKVPNTSPTAASVGSDLYGGAVVEACKQLAERLKPVREAMTRKNGQEPTWEQLVYAAYHQQVNLSAQGYYSTPDLHMDWNTGIGRPFSYFTYGTACSEVEVDTLTGDFHILRTDIVMDVGDSLNPHIDIGQIEGAYTQGMGLFTMEELVWGDSDHEWIRQKGTLFTRGPGGYKIPSFNDVPVQFNVHLLDNAPNKYAVYSSKAVGEPPLFLAASVFYAIKEAIRSARTDYLVNEKKLENQPLHFVLDSPATPERIRMACLDQFTESLVGNLSDLVNYRAKGSF
jgi:xanthine dehydrogenase/oxidase